MLYLCGVKIAIKGTVPQINEFQEWIPNDFNVEVFDLVVPPDADVICDFNPHIESILLAEYFDADDCLVILNTVFNTLEQFVLAVGRKPDSHIVGMNSLPTFINRSLVEYTAINPESEKVFLSFLEKMKKEGKKVSSRVGMVTPRVVCMIINEAFYTMQEGTANEADIDLGMKLGTAYPGGPFEWLEKIGIENVYQTLEALYSDTQEERYKICPLLKTRYLQSLID